MKNVHNNNYDTMGKQTVVSPSQQHGNYRIDLPVHCVLNRVKTAQRLYSDDVSNCMDFCGVRDPDHCLRVNPCQSHEPCDFDDLDILFR